ncbi:MAG: DUF2442 domain-containing protein [Cyanobacteria bacterium J06581_3]
MKCPHIIQAKLADEHTLMIQFSNQEIKQYSVQQLFTKQMFAPLQQPAFFRNFKIEPGGYALVWNEEIDISEYELRKNGTAVASKQSLATPIPERDEALD